MAEGAPKMIDTIGGSINHQTKIESTSLLGGIFPYSGYQIRCVLFQFSFSSHMYVLLFFWVTQPSFVFNFQSLILLFCCVCVRERELCHETFPDYKLYYYVFYII